MTTPSTPIKHVVIIVKENHTFDNYFGAFPGCDGMALPAAQNPPPADPGHTHSTWMTRFSDTRYMVQYGQADIPGYWDLASKFTLCDHFFSEVAGPSTPSHMMLVCADAPIIANPYNMYRPSATERFKLPCLPERLIENKLTWASYESYVFAYIKGLKVINKSRRALMTDISRNALPNVCWIYGDGTPNYSEHPVQNVTAGSNWTVSVIKAIAASKMWDSTMIFLTWDDWGGWYDHVTPPNIETWNHAHAQTVHDMYKSYDGQQFRYGSRVPCLVIGPYAKPGYVSSQLNSHVSIPKFVADNFGLQPLTGRDAASNGMTDCFDYTQTPLPPYA
jgi:phospholipase C